MDTMRAELREEEMRKVAEQAAEWLVTLEADSTADRTSFAEWIQESPLHVQMFLQASAVHQIGELVAPLDRRTLTERVLARDHNANVVHWRHDAIGMDSPSHSADSSVDSALSVARRPLRWIGAAAAIVTAISVGIWLFSLGPLSWTHYSTTIGEQRTLGLADGSVVSMNADTHIAVRYAQHSRQVQLRAGEALFTVAHETSRPFLVQVDSAVVRAVGTQFNINRRESGATVAVIEGVVQVSRSDNSHEASSGAEIPPGNGTERLAAGQALKLAPDGLLESPVAVNVAHVTAWQQRRLVFEWETLVAIAEEFNRYNRAPQIRVDGDDVRNRRFTAVFDADNPQALLKFLATNNDLEFAAEGGNFVIRAK